MKWLMAAFALLVSACQSPAPLAPLHRDHPLTNKILEVSSTKFVSYDKLISNASASRYVLLGEKHDNPDHHTYQARILKSLIEAELRPAVAMEMLNLH